MITPPWPRSFMWLKAGRLTQNVPFRCTDTTTSHIASSIFASVLSRRMPALFTTTSSCPKASSAVWTMRSPAATSATLS